MDKLPVINKDIAVSMARSMENENYFVEHLTHIENTNPVLADFIHSWARFYEEDEELQVHIAMCGIIVYRMLESQLEADAMKEWME